MADAISPSLAATVFNVRSEHPFFHYRTLPVSDPYVSRLRLIRDARFFEADRRESFHDRLGFAGQLLSCVCSADLTPPSSRWAPLSVYFCSNVVGTLTTR